MNSSILRLYPFPKLNLEGLRFGLFLKYESYIKERLNVKEFASNVNNSNSCLILDILGLTIVFPIYGDESGKDMFLL